MLKIVKNYFKFLSFTFHTILCISYNLSWLLELLPYFLPCTMYTSRHKWVPVTTAWRALRLRMEEVWGLGKVLTTPHRNIWLCYETWTFASDLDWYLRTTWASSG